MDNYKFIRYGKNLVIVLLDDSCCSDFDVINQRKVMIMCDSKKNVYSFFFELLRKVDLRYLAKHSELLSDEKSIVVSDLGILWDKLNEHYDLLSYEDLEEAETIQIINYMFRR